MFSNNKRKDLTRCCNCFICRPSDGPFWLDAKKGRGIFIDLCAITFPEWKIWVFSHLPRAVRGLLSAQIRFSLMSSCWFSSWHFPCCFFLILCLILTNCHRLVLNKHCKNLKVLLTRIRLIVFLALFPLQIFYLTVGVLLFIPPMVPFLSSSWESPCTLFKLRS